MFEWIKKLFAGFAMNRQTGYTGQQAGGTGRQTGYTGQQAGDARQQAAAEAKLPRDGGQCTSDGMITRTCRKCGKVITLPENVQHWPDYCQECRAKYRLVEPITRKCRGCGKDFTFSSDAPHWPKYCPECQRRWKCRS